MHLPILHGLSSKQKKKRKVLISVRTIYGSSEDFTKTIDSIARLVVDSLGLMVLGDFNLLLDGIESGTAKELRATQSSKEPEVTH